MKINQNNKNQFYKRSTLIIAGILLNTLGTISIIAPYTSTLATVITFGIILILSGFTYLIEALWQDTTKQIIFNIVLSIINILGGAAFLIQPRVGAISLTIILASYFIAAGLFKIYMSFSKTVKHKFLLIINGLLNLAAGIYIAVYLPVLSYFAIGILLGIELIFSGPYLIFSAFSSNNHTV